MAAGVSAGGGRLTVRIAALATASLRACPAARRSAPTTSAPLRPSPRPTRNSRAGRRPRRATTRSRAPGGRRSATPNSIGSNRRLRSSNQTLKADEANYREALALIAEARAGLFPTLNVNASAGRSSPGVDQFVAEMQASWAPDFWGKVRRQIEEEGSAAQASAATLANATLIEQSALATAYVTLREADSARQLYEDTVKQYQHSLEITQNQYNAGVAAKSDVITAQAQVLATQALLVETDVTPPHQRTCDRRADRQAAGGAQYPPGYARRPDPEHSRRCSLDAARTPARHRRRRTHDRLRQCRDRRRDRRLLPRHHAERPVRLFRQSVHIRTAASAILSGAMR